MEVRDDCGFATGQPFGALAVQGRRGQQLRQVIGEIQRDAAVAIAERLDADPRHLAGAEQRVEHRGRVVADAGRQDLACRAPTPRAARPAVARSRRAGRRARASAAPSDASRPGSARAPTASTGSTSWRNRASDRCRTVRSTSASHHSRPRPPGRNSPSTTRPLGQQLRKRGLDHRDAEAESRADVLAGERTVRPAEAPHQIADRIGDRLEQRHRQPRRQRHADRIAIARRILDRDEALFARRRIANRERPAAS